MPVINLQLRHKTSFLCVFCARGMEDGTMEGSVNNNVNMNGARIVAHFWVYSINDKSELTRIVQK